MTQGQISWSTQCSFYADNMGHCFEQGVTLCLANVTFCAFANGFEDSFAALDVLYNGPVLKNDVLDYLQGKKDRVKRANPLGLFSKPSLLHIELEGGKSIFLGLKAREFRQLLSVAQAKQKYSRTVSQKN